jgi:hypothetical protein
MMRKKKISYDRHILSILHQRLISGIIKNLSFGNRKEYSQNSVGKIKREPYQAAVSSIALPDI